MQRILVIGGAGLVGAAAALHLADLGYEVTIAGRNAPTRGPLTRLPFARGSYLTDDFSDDFLAGFDALVFAAGNDVRHLPPGDDEAQYFRRANSIGVPAFFARARDAGMKRAVYVGSYYTAVLPRFKIEASGYVRSRKEADDGVRALSSPDFVVCSLEAPFIMGHVEGVRALPLEGAVSYLLDPANQPFWMIPGGANFMSTDALAEAIAGALERGESGKAYLVGDENWSFVEYYKRLLGALGLPQEIATHDQEHPAIPDASLYSGRGVTIAYEPEAVSVHLLNYRRDDAGRAVREMAPVYKDFILNNHIVK